ncbi:MAG: cytochrome c biogenesis protein CcsA [Planctomycetota bacterium]
MSDPLVQPLTVFLPCGYLVVAMLYAMAFAGEAQPPIARIRTPLLRMLLVLHVGLFALHGGTVGGFPRFDSWLVLSAVALALVALFVAITWRRRQPTVGALVLFAAGTLQMVASMFGPTAPIVERGPSSAITAMHVLTVIFASAAVVLSGLYGVLYLLLLRQMRRQSFGALFRRLPDLRQLARMTRSAALAGFLGLVLGVNVGIGMAHARGVEGFGYTDTFVLSVLVICVHFGLIAFSRRIRGLTAQRASWAAVGGLTVLMAALAVALVPEATFHSLR